MDNYLNSLRNWPRDVSDCIERKEILVISKEKALNFVHGKDNQNKVSFYVSNDLVHVGILTLTKGKCSDPEIHRGDEALWVLQGNLQIITWRGESKEETVFQKCFSLRTNDKFLVPEGYSHQYFNLSDGNAEILFAISQGL